jgi:hypothetical protein
MANDLPWAEVTDSTWVPQFATEKIGALVRLSGPCPRCHHQTSTDFAAVIPGESLRASDEAVDLFCKCGFPHKGHPEGDASCGAYWTTSAEL